MTCRIFEPDPTLSQAGTGIQSGPNTQFAARQRSVKVAARPPIKLDVTDGHIRVGFLQSVDTVLTLNGQSASQEFFQVQGTDSSQ
jgi:hypothetical protein